MTTEHDYPQLTADRVPTATTEVLIAGAGPVGLTLALGLARRDISCTIVERRATPGTLPRMDLSNARTMEIYRQLGISEKIRAAGFPVDAPFDVYAGASLAVDPYAVLRYPSKADMTDMIAACRDATLPREPYERISQYNLEALLYRELCASPHVTIRFGANLFALHQHDSGVRSQVRDAAGDVHSIDSAFLVGCDGGGSAVREALDIGVSGQPNLGRNYLVFFRAPELLARAGLTPFRHFYLGGGARQGVLVAQDDLERWALHLVLGEDVDAAALHPDEEIRQALGVDVGAEVLYAGQWRPNLIVADRYRDRRAFLAGDAAHQYIPTGGFGLNTGIGDAHNLSWKLAALLQGWGGDALAESYHAERHPVGLRNMRASEYAAIGAMTWRAWCTPVRGRDAQDHARLLASAINTYQRRSHEQSGTELGYRYSTSPICAHDCAALPDPDSPIYQPSAAPGARLPHLWVSPGVSIHDLLGPDFTLIALDRPDAQRRFAQAADRHRIPLLVLPLDPRADLADTYGAHIVLVRPDHHVAWRGDDLGDLDAARILTTSAGYLAANAELRDA